VLELPPLAQATPQPAAGSSPAAGNGPARVLPTLEDAERLHADSDFSAFVTQGVDKAVQRLAMKKLFADPHFKLMDGLDIYIDDYNKSDPVSAAMLAALQHAKSMFPPLAADEPAPGDARATDQIPPGEGLPGEDPPSPPSPQGNA
jgi:hypothetical protein